MYYEDENNLYHYSYRKGDKVENVRDVDYTEVPNTAAKADPWEEKKPKKNRLGLKIAALALACALIGGAAGAGITHHAFASARGSTQIEVSDRQVAEVRQVKVDGKQQLTMPEVYAANVNSVVSINVSTTTNGLRPHDRSPPPAAAAFSSPRTATSSPTITSSRVRAPSRSRPTTARPMMPPSSAATRITTSPSSRSRARISSRS